MAQRPRSFTLNDKLTVLERARAEANVRLLKKWGSFIKQRFIDQKDWKYSRQWTIEWLDFALTGVYQLWQNHLGKVKEDKGKIKVVLGKSGITPKYPRGWGWVTGSRGRVGPSWAVRERIERVSWRRPHGCDQRGNCWVVRLQRFWRKSSFVALTWKSKKKNNGRAFVTDSSLTSSKLPSQTSLWQPWAALVSDGCFFSDEPVDVQSSGNKRVGLEELEEFS